MGSKSLRKKLDGKKSADDNDMQNDSSRTHRQTDNGATDAIQDTNCTVCYTSHETGSSADSL